MQGKASGKHYIQLEESFLIVYADCSRELNAIPGEQTVERDISKEGFYDDMTTDDYLEYLVLGRRLMANKIKNYYFSL